MSDFDTAMTDEELWNSPVGLRLRTYADILLAAEQERIEMTARRKDAYTVAAGVGEARGIVSPLGKPFDREDAWASHTSDALEGLRAVIEATDGTSDAVQDAVKAYIPTIGEDTR